jgi:hypothetical protein
MILDTSNRGCADIMEICASLTGKKPNKTKLTRFIQSHSAIVVAVYPYIGDFSRILAGGAEVFRRTQGAVS